MGGEVGQQRQGGQEGDQGDEGQLPQANGAGVRVEQQRQQGEGQQLSLIHI